MPIRPALLVDLCAVVPGPVDPSSRFEVLWVELYSDGLVMHYRFDAPLREMPHPREGQGLDWMQRVWESIEIADDVATAYARGGAGSGSVQGPEGVVRLAGHVSWAPAVPSAARALTVRHGDALVTLALGEARG